ncbi:MAG: hypothetical protein ABSG41_21105 [Bryobacteraceae bacterium]
MPRPPNRRSQADLNEAARGQRQDMGGAISLPLAQPTKRDNEHMGSLTFDFLTDSFLFRDDLIDQQFASIPVSEIERELDRYREFCITNQAALMADVDGESSNLTIYAPERVSLPDLTQAALYVHQYVLQDPLLPLTGKRSESAKVLASGTLFESGTVGNLNLGNLSTILRTMKALTPMIAADFVKLVPSSLALEDPEEIPIYASDNYFEDVLPAEILRLFKEAARVSTVIPQGKGRMLLEKLRPSRSIDIRFRGDLEDRGYAYVLRKIEEATRKDGATNEFTMRLTLPDTPPDLPQFRVWVQQSINQSARRLFRDVCGAAELAATLKIAYSTRSQLRFNALRKAINPDKSAPVRTANVFLNLDLPFIKDIDVERLMQIRRDEGEAFHNFRFALNHKLSTLREVSDPLIAKKEAAEALRELTEVQLHDVGLKIRSVREKLGYSALGSLVCLAAAVQNQGFSLLSAAAAAVPIGSAALDYRKEVKRHPAFFLWKVLSNKARHETR